MHEENQIKSNQKEGLAVSDLRDRAAQGPRRQTLLIKSYQIKRIRFELKEGLAGSDLRGFFLSVTLASARGATPRTSHPPTCHQPDVRLPGKGNSKLPWREAGPPNHHDDKVDSDQ